MLVFVSYAKSGGLIPLCASLCCLGARANHHSKKLANVLELFLRDFVIFVKCELLS